MNRAEKNRIYTFWLYLFFGSFLLGVIVMNMGSEKLLSEDGIFSISSINRLKYIEIDSGRFLRYVLKHRIGEGLALVLLSTTGFGAVSVYICILWQGLLAGMTITAAIIRFGIRGFLLLLGGMFPHQLLLIPAEIMLLGWCYERCGKERLAESYMSSFAGSRKQRFLRQGIMLMWISIVILIGCILESYVNPILISDVVKIF